nr:diphosphoinositol polyphosphate phosphohydrolase aps1 [Quercus suber]
MGRKGGGGGAAWATLSMGFGGDDQDAVAVVVAAVAVAVDVVGDTVRVQLRIKQLTSLSPSGHATSQIKAESWAAEVSSRAEWSAWTGQNSQRPFPRVPSGHGARASRESAPPPLPVRSSVPEFRPNSPPKNLPQDPDTSPPSCQKHGVPLSSLSSGSILVLSRVARHGSDLRPPLIHLSSLPAPSVVLHWLPPRWSSSRPANPVRRGQRDLTSHHPGLHCPSILTATRSLQRRPVSSPTPTLRDLTTDRRCHITRHGTSTHPGALDGGTCGPRQAKVNPIHDRGRRRRRRRRHEDARGTLPTDHVRRFGPNGERLVAGVVPLNADRTKVLLIQSSARKGWVLPKGGWETDEATPADAACREAWEEAGIECRVEQDLGEINEKRSEAQIKKNPFAPRASYRFFEVRVKEEKDSWPEKHKRDRQWMSYAKARECLRDRPELLEALERSNVKRC